MWTVLKNYFLKIWKITMKTLYVKKIVLFLNKFLYFQSCNYKIFMKIYHVSKVFYMFKTLKKNMWTSGLFVSKIFSPFLNVHQIVSIFLGTLIYSTRGDPCVQNIQKIKIHIFLDFNTRMSFYTIIILNL